ncbi:hypothetical protein [Peribacillus muralis]|uniref:hypothetical protein n=1 Tax=Peribacillus muralis TaxID=264697 RepID=UPI00070CF6E7|nr:hypothetical protein [Peribacillus muralis]
MDNSFTVVSVADMLGVSSSTVKKYYLLMEEKNYRFKRNQKGKLTFSYDDVNLFRRLILLKNEPGMSVNKAAVQLVQESGVAQQPKYGKIHESAIIERDLLFIHLLRDTKKELLAAIKEVDRLNEERIEEFEENIEQRFKRVYKNLKSLKDKEGSTLINQ